MITRLNMCKKQRKVATTHTLHATLMRGKNRYVERVHAARSYTISSGYSHKTHVMERFLLARINQPTHLEGFKPVVRHHRFVLDWCYNSTHTRGTNNFIANNRGPGVNDTSGG